MFVRKTSCVHEEVLLGHGGAPCLFAIRSDRQHSHIHHCHLPLDFPLSSFLFFHHPSLLSLLPHTHPTIPPSPPFFCFPQHQWNSTFCQELDISIISLVILSTFLFASPAHSIFLSPVLPFFSTSVHLLLTFPFLIYLWIYRHHLGCPHSWTCWLTAQILIPQFSHVCSDDSIFSFCICFFMRMCPCVIIFNPQSTSFTSQCSYFWSVIFCLSYSRAFNSNVHFLFIPKKLMEI